MKIFLILSLLSFSAFAQENGPIGLHCASDMPTTTFDMTTEGDSVLLKVKHVNGVQFMPIHEGVIVPHDFSYLKEKANSLTKMGTTAEFRFPRSRCRIEGKGIVSCGGGERKTFGDIEVEALNFYTGKVHEETLGLSLDSWKATLSLKASDFFVVMDMTMVYGEKNCQFSGF